LHSAVIFCAGHLAACDRLAAALWLIRASGDADRPASAGGGAPESGSGV